MEDMDCADLLVAAARMASRTGLTKEQFINSASVFWDSWHAVNVAMTDPLPHPPTGETT